jgi:hypothetical protein
MALQLLVNGVDLTNQIKFPSLRKSENLTKSPDDLSFVIVGLSGKTIPSLGDEVELFENTTKIFGGILTEVSESTEGAVVTHAFKCKDYSQTFDRQLVVKSYENMSITDIVKDIVDEFTDGEFTYTNVDTGLPIIETVKFNYEQPSRCLEKLANLINYDWFIDYNKDVHFFKASNNPAPFNLTETGNNHIWNSLQFNRNIIELKNYIIVRGGEYKSTISEANTPDVYEANGTDRVFYQIYRYANVGVTVDGIPQTIGIDNITDPNTVDVLYNFQEKAVKFRENNKPVNGAEVKIFGDAYIPLIAKVRDQVSIGAYGRYDYVIIDKNITSIDEARLRGKAELLKWQNGSYEASFKTRQTGLRTGQYIIVDSPFWGVSNQPFKITRINGTAYSPDAMEYDVHIAISGEVSFVDIMLMLLGKDKLNVSIAQDEVLQALELLSDEFAITDSEPTITTDSPPYTWGVGGSNDGKWGFSTWS